MRRQPRLRRRRAARADQLPELRQPGEAAHRLAAHRGGRGLADACEALDVPVVGGNVSLYNEGADGPIYPTPVVGMVGRLPDAARAGVLGLRAARATRSRSSARCGRRCRLGAGQAARRARRRGRCPSSTSTRSGPPTRGPRGRARAARWRAPTTSPRAAWPWRWPSAASLGGIGAEVEWAGDDQALFGEAPGRAFVVSRPGRGARRAARRARQLGRVGGDRLALGPIDVGDRRAARRPRRRAPRCIAA